MKSPDAGFHHALRALLLLPLLAAGAAGAQEDRREPSTLLPLEELWTTVLPAPPAAAPLHDAGRLYVPLRDGQMLAIGVRDGAVVWETMQGVRSGPTLGGGLYYAPTANTLSALDLESGVVVWEVPLRAPLSAPLVWNNGWLIAALENRALLAMQAQTGETIWERALGGVAHVRPALAADRMYVSLDNGGLLALSLRGGELVWEQQLDGPPSEALPLDDLFVGAADNHFYRISRVDGAIKWRWRTGGDIVGRPAVDAERVFFSSLDNVVWALDRNSGNQRWRQSLLARPTDGPGHADDLLVLSGLGRVLSFHHPEDGVLYGRMQTPTEVAYAPLVVTDPDLGPLVLYVTGDGRLKALSRGATPGLADPETAPLFVKKAPVSTADAGADADDAETDDAETEDADGETEDADGESGPALVSALLPPPPLDGSPPSAAPPEVSPTAAAAAPSPAPAAASARTPGRFAIQVSALSNRDAAAALAARLVAAGYPAYVVEPAADVDPPLYRVRLGDYPDRAAAEAAGGRVETSEGLDWYVVALP